MKRFLPWLLTSAAHGVLIAATVAMVGSGWISETHAVVIAALQLLYAGATITFGAWRALALAAVPALWLGDLALFMDADAYDCYPGCTPYQDALGWGLNVPAVFYLLVLAFALHRLARRVPRRRDGSPLRLGR
jgi:hypothetical protein